MGDVLDLGHPVQRLPDSQVLADFRIEHEVHPVGPDARYTASGADDVHSGFLSSHTVPPEFAGRAKTRWSRRAGVCG